MNRNAIYGCFLSIFIIVGCNSSNGDSVMAGAASDLQGRWASTCEVIADRIERVERVELTVSGSSLTFAFISYLNSSTCDGLTSLTFTINGTFSIDGTQTPLDDGSANNIDIILSGGAVSGSPALLELFESQGTTLAAFLVAQGITGDPNNLSLAELPIDQAQVFDIFRIDTTDEGTDRLTFGAVDDSFTGDTPALRPIRLDDDASFLRIL